MTNASQAGRWKPVAIKAGAPDGSVALAFGLVLLAQGAADSLAAEGISVTSEDQIVLELAADDLVPPNPFDLAGKTLLFTPDGRGGYARSVRAVAWEEDIGSPVDDNAEIALPFPFEFSGRQWESFFFSRYGLITFGQPYPFPRRGPSRWGTMPEIADSLAALTAISALYKPRLGGWSTWHADEAGNTQHVSRRPDRVVLTWITEDHEFYVHGRPPREKTRFQIVLHADGRVAFHYAAAPEDSEEAIRDGIVGLFPEVNKTEAIARIPDATRPGTPAHLDLVETAIYRTTHPGFVMVEFTTRGPIRPDSDMASIYYLFLDTERPWWANRSRDKDDEDLYWGRTAILGLTVPAPPDRIGAAIGFPSRFACASSGQLLRPWSPTRGNGTSQRSPGDVQGTTTPTPHPSNCQKRRTWQSICRARDPEASRRKAKCSTMSIRRSTSFRWAAGSSRP